MKSIMIILAGLGLCGIGAYAYIHDMDMWGAWVLVGAIIIGTQVD